CMCVFMCAYARGNWLLPCLCVPASPHAPDSSAAVGSPSSPFDAMHALVGVVLDAARKTPGRAHSITRALGQVLGQVRPALLVNHDIKE
ncbi:MAG: hypothetical protein ACK53Y_02590, partial [bacterium]